MIISFVLQIMRETGFLEGLYTSDELNPDNIKDRDGKIAFLEKLIAAVSKLFFHNYYEDIFEVMKNMVSSF